MHAYYLNFKPAPLNGPIITVHIFEIESWQRVKVVINSVRFHHHLADTRNTLIYVYSSRKYIHACVYIISDFNPSALGTF